MCDPVTPEERAIVAFFLYKSRHKLDEYLSESFVHKFEERGILQETDVAYLENTKFLGHEIWSEELLRLLAFRPNGFQSLIDVLTENGEHEQVYWIKKDLYDEFEQCWEVEPPSFTHVPPASIQFNSGRGKFSKKWARRVLQSWRIPFADCLSIEENEEEIPTSEGPFEKFWIPSYAPRPTPVPDTKAHYFYAESHVLGRGQTSTVFSGYWDNDPNVKVAVKYVHKNANAIISTREIELAKQIWRDRTPASAHVVPVLDWSRKEDAYYIILEQAWGTLDHAVETNFRNLREDRPKMLQLLEHCAHGLQWVHKTCIAHGDVNPKNVMIFEYTDNELCAKLGDFGYCRTSDQSGSSLIFQSPESLTRVSDESEPASDIFSLGLLYHYALSGGQHPFRGESLHILRSPSPRLLDMTVHWRFPAAQNIISEMLHRTPEQRPIIAHVLQHPIFWEEEKCLGFLEDVSRALSNKSYSEQCQNIRQGVDELYRHEHPDFDWVSLVDRGFFERQGKSGKKNYNSNSLLSLVELIRDKAEHYQDMVQSLREVLFTQTQLPFNRKAYAEYFLTRFPQIVIHLFSWMNDHAGKHECLGLLRDKYFFKSEIIVLRS